MDKWRFAVAAHQCFSTIPDGEPSLQESWSQPNLVMDLLRAVVDTVCDGSNRGLAPSG